MTLVDTEQAAALARMLGRKCSPATIRKWASKGWITAKGRKGKRVLYDIDEIQCVAQWLGHS